MDECSFVLRREDGMRDNKPWISCISVEVKAVEKEQTAYRVGSGDCLQPCENLLSVEVRS